MQHSIDCLRNTSTLVLSFKILLSFIFLSIFGSGYCSDLLTHISTPHHLPSHVHPHLTVTMATYDTVLANGRCIDPETGNKKYCSAKRV